MGSTHPCFDLRARLISVVSLSVFAHIMAGNVERKEFDKSKFEGKPIVWVMGGPGSGKGTQCEKIALKFGFTHLSSGDLLRAEVMSGSKRGQQLYMTMANGNAVPSEIVTDLLGEAMVAKADSKGFLVDGFPIHMGQAEIFVTNIGTPTRVIAFEASEEVLTGRLMARGNFDDTEDSVKKRLANYTENTKPVIEKFKAETINVERAADDIFADVEKLF